MVLKYQDGTTDITRTVHFGKPSAHVKACYTAVGGLSYYHSDLKTLVVFLVSQCALSL